MENGSALFMKLINYHHRRPACRRHHHSRPHRGARLRRPGPAPARTGPPVPLRHLSRLVALRAIFNIHMIYIYIIYNIISYIYKARCAGGWGLDGVLIEAEFTVFFFASAFIFITTLRNRDCRVFKISLCLGQHEAALNRTVDVRGNRNERSSIRHALHTIRRHGAAVSARFSIFIIEPRLADDSTSQLRSRRDL
jgi:hypothetical protein